MNGSSMGLPDEHLRMFLDAVPDALIITDAAGRIIFANAQAETLFGYQAGELTAQSVELLLPARLRERHPEHRAAFRASPRRRPMGVGPEIFGRRRDGSEFPAEISLSPVQTAAGLFVSSVIRDVTERRAIEAQLLAASHESERANRAKSAFLAAASHDLRQPLQALTMLHGALSRAPAPDGATAANLALQGESLRAMSDLLNALLDISKLESGAVNPDISDCAVTTIFARLRAEFTDVAQSRGLELIVEDCDSVVRTDPVLLTQIIQNLIANAIRYTRAGWVRLRALRTATAVRIEVLDTGIGIPASEMESIFEEFHQVPRGPGHPREGLGLGLAIVRRLANLLGHPVEVTSELGSGSCFAVNVPRSEAPVAAERYPTAAHPVSSVHLGRRILIIDDDDAVARSTALLLRVGGCDVSVAPDSSRACRGALEASAPPEMLLCDYHLAAGENGVNAVRAVRAALKREVPALLVTGDTSLDVLEAARQLGACTLLRKPVESEELFRSIERLAAGQPKPQPERA